jgi:amino acid permease
MLYESNRLNYYTNKYITLFIGLIIIVNTITLIVENFTSIELNADTIVTSIIIGIILWLCVWIHLRYRDKWKIVAIGKTKIVIDENNGETEYGWLDVEYIHLDRFLRYYTLKIKGRDEILFTPYGFVNIFTGDESDMGVIINKMKKELSI